jgi:hypothetical protein
MIQELSLIGMGSVALVSGLVAFRQSRRAERLNDLLKTSRELQEKAKQALRHQLERAETRATVNASAWGRVMHQLRVAQDANKKLRTDQLRRQLIDSLDQVAA